MKKSISLILCLCLIFCFTVPIHASATSWDTSDQANLQSIMRAVTSYGTSNLYYYVSQINSNINTIKNDISTIKGYLFSDGHSISYWTNAISSWMSPIYNAIISLPSVTDFEHIIGGLNLVTGDSSSGYTYTPYLYYGNKSNANWLSDLYTLDNKNGYESQAGGTRVAWRSLGGNGVVTAPEINMSGQNWRTNIATGLLYTNNNVTRGLGYIVQGFANSQNVINWGNLGTSTFTPISSTDGIYKYLNAIQAPVARLSYVLASNERIEAQEAAALNEEAVVDNFIDSQGSGSASVSDYTAIAGLSSGFSSNVSTDASPSGIWDIFDSSHGTWFSQETYNQLDTTVQTRSYTFETPYLDQQIEDIYNIIGGDEKR